jgi:hypothetical protein
MSELRGMRLSYFFLDARTADRSKPAGISRTVVRAAFLAGFASVCSAQTSLDQDFDDQNKAWSEVVLKLPAAPAPENLLPFYVSPTATQSFAIDVASLVVGVDGVIRFTLVSTSASGARNVSYEGIRCLSYERKSYAFGHPDGSWSRSRRDRWEPIVNNAANRTHASLAQDFFCEGQMISGKAEQILEKMRNRQPKS